eukprot:53157-Eustigmatos_ZCMA.PRE.1
MTSLYVPTPTRDRHNTSDCNNFSPHTAHDHTDPHTLNITNRRTTLAPSAPADRPVKSAPAP